VVFSTDKTDRHDITEILLKVALSTIKHIKQTNVVIAIPVHSVVYSIQHYVIKFVSDLRQVGGFLLFPPPIKLTATIQLKYS
jgi:hypothetical protein